MTVVRIQRNVCNSAQDMGLSISFIANEIYLCYSCTRKEICMEVFTATTVALKSTRPRNL